jgi:hypothetical protein
MPTPATRGAATAAATTGTTTTLTSTSSINSNELAVLVTWMLDNRTISSITGDNGLSWQKDEEVNGTSGSLSIWSAYASSGVTSGSTFIANYSSITNGNVAMALVSIPDILSSSWKDVSTRNTIAAQANWDTGTTSTRSTDLQIDIGAAGENSSTSATSVTNSPAVELYDNPDTLVNGRLLTVAYNDNTTVGSVGTSNITGTFTSGAHGAIVAAIVSYKVVGGAAPPSVPGPKLRVVQSNLRLN